MKIIDNMDGIKARCEYVSDSFLAVNNCGRVSFEKTRFSSRPEGRKDYMLLYVTEGSGFCLIDGAKHSLGAGDMVVLRPLQPLVFSFSGSNSHYWLHFTGTDAEGILASVGISANSCFNVGQSEEITKLFFRIIFEMQMNRKTSGMMCNGLFLELISAVGNKIKHERIVENDITESKIYPAIRSMMHEYTENRRLPYYAALCNLSLSHFKTRFTEEIGFSPTAYLNKLKLEHAKNFLFFTNLSVTEIACRVGFSDPLYFSRFFKKHVGVSPREFRALINSGEIATQG